LPLLWLYLENFPASPWQGDPQLMDAVHALLEFWCRHRYADGTLDEWYVGERAFAAAAFTTHAVARTLADGANVLETNLIEQAKTALNQTAFWLAGQEDLFKTNHQAVGVAAMAWAGKVLDAPQWTANARHKLAVMLPRQNQEGWFPEVGHMDVGYTFLTVEFLAMTMDLWQEWHHLPSLIRAFEFACQWVHPDLTTGEEYGICHNPYLSTIAVVYLSNHSPQAAWLRYQLEEKSRGFSGIAHTLADDLRLLRWGFQPLLAWKLQHQYSTRPTLLSQPIPLMEPSPQTGITPFSLAGLLRLFAGGHAILAPVAGGLLRLFSPATTGEITDAGYAIGLENGFATNTTYHPTIPWKLDGKTVILQTPLLPVRKFMPSFASRLILRLACTTSLGSRLARRGIDFIRKRKGNAVNQSSANLYSTRSSWQLQRTVTCLEDGLQVNDRLSFQAPLAMDRLFFLMARDHKRVLPVPATDLLPSVKGSSRFLNIRKRYQFDHGWSCIQLDADFTPPGKG
ncbi:MAG: hypothetical protein HQL55_20455, partial [Magnetococcales bacterium]|nr:hypothetical protein [Magnetococcales bacterium]